MANDPCAEFKDLSDRDIEVRLQMAGAGWTPDKVKRAERCLKARALVDKRAENAPQVWAAWGGVLAIVVVAIIGGIYTVWPIIIDAVSTAYAAVVWLVGS